MKTRLLLSFLGAVFLGTSSVSSQEVTDMTDKIVNADFTLGLDGWTTELQNIEGYAQVWSTKSDVTPCVVEAYAGYSQLELKAFALTQQVTLEAGKYRLISPSFYRWGTSYNSDINNADGLGARSYAYLVAGNDSVAVCRLGDVSGVDLRPVSYANSMLEASAAFNAGLYNTTLYFDLANDTTITLGYRGTNDRDKCWFIAGPLTLQKIADTTVETEKTAEWNSYKTLYTTLKEKYTAISEQQESRTTFETAQADEAFAAATTIEEIESAIRMLGDALAAYMLESDDLFDLTSLLVNPGFETGDMTGWSCLSSGDWGIKETADSIYRMAGSEGDYLFNTYIGSQTASYNYYLLQTVKYLPAGLYELSARLASTESGSDLAVVAGDRSAKVSSADKYVAELGTLTFRLNANSDLRLGATSNRWFKADDFRLYFTNDAYVLRKPLMTKLDVYEKIAAQATDRTAYDTAINDILQRAKVVQTSQDVEILREEAFTAMKEMLKTVPARTGLYDLTCMLLNPNFVNGHISWTQVGTATYSYEIGEFFDNTGTFSIKQTLSNMPEGWYTVTAKALSRQSDFTSALNTYLTGTPKVKASLLLDSKKETVCNIFDDTRFATTSTGFEYNSMPDGSSLPNTMNKANQIFGFGHYNNILRYEKTKAGDVVIGLTQTNGSEKNWLAFDEFHLYYGKAREVNLDTIQKMVKTYANVTSSRVLKANKLEAVCFPYQVDLTQFDAVYELASAKGDKAILVPAREMKIGRTYFVKTNADTTIEAQDVVLTSVQPDSIPAYWNGVFQKTAYAKGRVDGAYILNSDGTALEYVTGADVPACTPRFYFPVSMNVYEPFIPVEIQDDMMDMAFEMDIENNQVKEFVHNNTYDRETASVVTNYNIAPSCRRDQPRGAWIPIPTLASKPRKMNINYGLNADMTECLSVKLGRENNHWFLFNMIPDTTYYYEVIADEAVIAKGTFDTKGKVRMLRFNSGSNMRDMGGWITADGRRVKYGKVYRGGELHKGFETTMKDNDLLDFLSLGISAELDLRNNDQVENSKSPGSSALGADVPYIYLNQYLFADDALQQDTIIYRKAFNFIADNLNEGRIVYFHCIWGADRTGALAMLINGLLGVTLDQLYKDYELTSFSKAGVRAKTGLDSKLDYLAQYGGTLKDQITRYLIQYVKVSGEQLRIIRRNMLDGEDTAIEDITAEQQVGPSVIYDLQGRIVTNPVRRGIYIKNGKKFIVR